MDQYVVRANITDALTGLKHETSRLEDLDQARRAFEWMEKVLRGDENSRNFYIGLGEFLKSHDYVTPDENQSELFENLPPIPKSR